jgi:hypothetical protein
MFKVKTFGMEIRPMKTVKELAELDENVNTFLSGGAVKRVISVSDSLTTSDSGETIGIVRVVCYEA